MSMELIVDPVKEQKITIKNKDELIKELKNKLVVYNKVITEDKVQEGKQDRANLNKLFTAIEAKRKEIKSDVMTPYNEVEKDFKEITGLIKEASDKIDEQVKVFEDKKKEDKKAEIKEYFNNVINYNFIKFDDVFNDKWLNSSTSMKSMQTDIDNLKDKTDKDIEAIKQLGSRFETTLLSKYYDCRDLGTVILEKNRLEKIEQEQERIKVLQEQAKSEATQEIVQAQNSTETVQDSNYTTEQEKEPEMYHRAFEVWGNREQIIALGNFMNENNIKFKKIEGVN